MNATSEKGRTSAEAGMWESLADTILADVARDSVHPSGRWQRAPDDERVDAALLLPAIRGATDASARLGRQSDEDGA